MKLDRFSSYYFIFKRVIFLKRIISLFSAVLLLFCAGCSSKPSEKEINNYVGEGMMTNFKLLFSENEYFVNEVFVNSHLPIDASKTVAKDGKSYAKVVSDRYDSYSALEAAVKSVYSEAAAEKLLKEKSFYADINGELYFDIGSDFERLEGPTWNIEKAKTISVGEGEYVFSIPCKIKGKSTDSQFKVILDNNEWRLEEAYVN